MKRYLEFYNKCMESGLMPEKGLCYSLPLQSQRYDLHELFDQGLWYWGYTGEFEDTFGHSDYSDCRYKFTPLRQNIVLFLAAMNGEL